MQSSDHRPPGCGRCNPMACLVTSETAHPARVSRIRGWIELLPRLLEKLDQVVNTAVGQPSLVVEVIEQRGIFRASTSSIRLARSATVGLLFAFKGVWDTLAMLLQVTSRMISLSSIRVSIRWLAREKSCASVKALQTMTQSIPAVTAEFSPLDESSTTSVSSLVAP